MYGSNFCSLLILGAFVILTVVLPAGVLYHYAPSTTDCTPEIAHLAFIKLCTKLRILWFVLGAVGAFVVVVLCCWVANDLAHLRRTFELPWFGLGDDVENVGSLESVLRAGVFTAVLWAAIGLCLFAYSGMTRTLEKSPAATQGQTKDAPDAPKPAPPQKSSDLARFIAPAKAAVAPNNEADRSADQPPVRPEPAADLPGPQQQRDEALREIRAILVRQDERQEKSAAEQRAALRTLAEGVSELARQQRDPVHDEVKRLEATLTELRKLIDTQGGKLATLDSTTMPAVVDKVNDMSRTLDEKLTRRAREQDDAFGDEVKRLGSTLAEIRALIKAQGDKLALLKDVSQPPNTLDGKTLPGVTDAVSSLMNALDAMRQSARDQNALLQEIDTRLKQHDSSRLLRRNRKPPSRRQSQRSQHRPRRASSRRPGSASARCVQSPKKRRSGGASDSADRLRATRQNAGAAFALGAAPSANVSREARGCGAPIPAHAVAVNEAHRLRAAAYCHGEIDGISVLIAGQRGAGKTTLAKLAIQDVMAKSEGLIPLPLTVCMGRPLSHRLRASRTSRRGSEWRARNGYRRSERRAADDRQHRARGRRCPASPRAAAQTTGAAPTEVINLRRRIERARAASDRDRALSQSVAADLRSVAQCGARVPGAAMHRA